MENDHEMESFPITLCKIQNDHEMESFSHNSLYCIMVPLQHNSLITWSISLDPKYSDIKGLHCIAKNTRGQAIALR